MIAERAVLVAERETLGRAMLRTLRDLFGQAKEHIVGIGGTDQRLLCENAIRSNLAQPRDGEVVVCPLKSGPP